MLNRTTALSDSQIFLTKDYLETVTYPAKTGVYFLSSQACLQGKSLHTMTGVLDFKNGNSYSGELFYGIMNGEGKFTWKDGTEYTGTFKHNKIVGDGSI